VFSRFEGLQVLVLNNNSIDAVPHAWWKKGLHGLNTLVLSHNRIASLSDSGLSKLTLLTKLSASHNQLTELPDLSACTLLQELRLGYNRLASNMWRVNSF
jgi:Leucine-rich repeat (LRR) protein